MTRRLQHLSPVLLAALIAAACGTADRGASVFQVRDSAGVHLVTTGERGVWGTAAGWRLRETLRISGAAGGSGKGFSSVADLGLDGDGDVLVLDPHDGRVVVFDSTGRWMRSFGRAGSGPGAFSSSASAIVVSAGDTVFIADGARFRVVVFASNGTPIGSFDTPLQAGQALRWGRSARGKIVEQARTALLPGADSAAPENVLVERSSRGTVLDTLLHLPLGDVPNLRGGKVRLFAPEARWDIGDHGRVLVAVSDVYRVAEYDSTGTLRTVIDHPYEPRPVTADDQDALKKLLATAMISRGSVPPAFITQIVNNIEFAPTYPAIGFLFNGPNGSALVQHGATLEELRERGGTSDVSLESIRRGSPNWDVFDRSGRYLGVLTFPERFTPKRVAGTAVYGVETDSTGAPSVVRLAIDTATQDGGASASPAMRSSRSRTTAR